MFAREPIAKGETVAVVGGELLHDDEFRRRTAGVQKYNAIQVDEGLDLLGHPDELAEATINHSCDGNLWLADEVTIVARREIAAGEELTIDYALFTTADDWVLDADCRCGADVCRRRVTGGDWRLSEVQVRYAGHFSPFLNRRIASLAGAR
jgi:hypothetical protein